MPGLATAVRWEMVILIGGLKVKGGHDEGTFSPARLQMLMSTVLAAMYYLLQVINNRGSNSLPDVPATLIGILGGSHAIYLGGKVQSFQDQLFGKGGRKDDADK